MASTNDNSEQKYSIDAVEQILQRAAAEPVEEHFTQRELLEMASELNISPEALTHAERAWRSEQSQKRAARQTDKTIRSRFPKEIKSYVVVNTFLIGLNVILCGTISWAIYPLMGWGIGLILGPCQGSSVTRKSCS